MQDDDHHDELSYPSTRTGSRPLAPSPTCTVEVDLMTGDGEWSCQWYDFTSYPSYHLAYHYFWQNEDDVSEASGCTRAEECSEFLADLEPEQLEILVATFGALEAGLVPQPNSEEEFVELVRTVESEWRIAAARDYTLGNPAALERRTRFVATRLSRSRSAPLGHADNYAPHPWSIDVAAQAVRRVAGRQADHRPTTTLLTYH